MNAELRKAFHSFYRSHGLSFNVESGRASEDGTSLIHNCVVSGHGFEFHADVSTNRSMTKVWSVEFGDSAENLDQVSKARTYLENNKVLYARSDLYNADSNAEVFSPDYDVQVESLKHLVSELWFDLKHTSEIRKHVSAGYIAIRYLTHSEYKCTPFNLMYDTSVIENLRNTLAASDIPSEIVNEKFQSLPSAPESVALDPEVKALGSATKKPSTPRAPKAAGEKSEKAPRASGAGPNAEYPNLSASFFRGGLKGQIGSIHKDLDNVARCMDFIKALKAGALTGTIEEVSTLGAKDQSKFKEIENVAEGVPQ